jgi:hypothetical protein
MGQIRILIVPLSLRLGTRRPFPGKRAASRRDRGRAFSTRICGMHAVANACTGGLLVPRSLM